MSVDADPAPGGPHRPGRHRPLRPRLLGAAAGRAARRLRPAAPGAAFRLLRRARDADDREPGPGYYAVTRYADLEAISSQPALFCSGKGAVSIPDMPGRPQRVLRLDDQHGRPAARQDPPDRVQGLHPADARAAGRLGAADRRRRRWPRPGRRRRPATARIDVVADIAAPIPLRVICDMMGVPEEDRADGAARSPTSSCPAATPS